MRTRVNKHLKVFSCSGLQWANNNCDVEQRHVLNRHSSKSFIARRHLTWLLAPFLNAFIFYVLNVHPLVLVFTGTLPFQIFLSAHIYIARLPSCR